MSSFELNSLLPWCLDCFPHSLQRAGNVGKSESVQIIPLFCLNRKWTNPSCLQGEARSWQGIAGSAGLAVSAAERGSWVLAASWREVGAVAGAAGTVVSGEGLSQWKSWPCWAHRPGTRILRGNKNICPHKSYTPMPPATLCNRPKWK